MTIEKLEALERAKDDQTCSVDEFVDRCTQLAYAQQAAFPALLAVAKAAKLYLSECREHNPCPCPILRKDYRDKLIAALAQLEATP